MVTLAFALLCAFVLGWSWEGTIRARGVLSSCTLWRVGRVHAMAWSYRPGRIYVRLGVRYA